jgi:hypothetical protein
MQLKEIGTMATVSTHGNATALYLAKKKSVFIAVTLTFFFGPLGMLYSTILGAFVVFLLTMLAIFLTAGIGLIIVWPLSMFWAGFAVDRRNKRLAASIG